MAFCPNCGKRVGAQITFCSGCGSRMTPVATKAAVAGPKSTHHTGGGVNGLVKAGGVGFILLVVAGALALINLILTWTMGWAYVVSGMLFIMAIIIAAITMTAILLLALGGFGLKKQHNHVLGLILFIIGMITFALQLITLILGFFSPGIAFTMGIIATVIFAAFLSIYAVMFIIIREKTKSSTLTIVTAIMLFVYVGMATPAMFLPILGIVSAPILIATGILGTIVMFKG